MSLPHPLSPEERARFDEQVERLTGGITYVAMPPIRFAEYSEDFNYWADLSDKKQFNERYIDSYNRLGNVAFAINMSFFMHNLGLILAIIIYFNTWSILLSIGLYIGVGMHLPLNIWKFKRMGGVGEFIVRFNRQAQMVHRATGGKKNGWFSAGGPLSVAWRDAVPVIKRGSDPFYIFPNYRSYRHQGTSQYNKPIFISAAFEYDLGPKRFEFIRRYMESGLDAITPPPDLEKDKLQDLSAFPARFHRGWYYHCGFGPWVDRWLKKKIDEYRWPEEIERLGAPGADLSGIDTTPVKSIDTCFYRVGRWMAITYVKPDGTPY